MADYVLSCCSTADLSKEHMEKRSIHFVCFHFMLNGEMYIDDLGQSIPFDEFYARMAKGESTRTSQVNADEFITYFSGFLDQGLDILHVCLSSGLSGVYNSACIARDELKEKYPDRKIVVVDSLGASSGYGLFMDTLADMRDGGADFATVCAWAQENRLKLHHWFCSTDLSYYVKGGRISRAEGWFGTVLRICPVLNMDAGGKLTPRSKARGKKRALAELLDHMVEHAQGGLDYSGKCFISQSACYEDARSLADAIEEKFPKLNGKVQIFSIGTTIGAHTGPGTIALFFWGDQRD